MQSMAKWLKRSFKDLPKPDVFPMLVERLRGTPIRVEEKVAGVASEILTRREGEDWSVQEHLGHLYDLEELWLGRFDDFAAGKETLRPWDGINQKTYEANHNKAELSALLHQFRSTRESMVAQLDAFSESQVITTALHPRLKQPMRAIDLVYFIAEHDDHHLAMMQRLLV